MPSKRRENLSLLIGRYDKEKDFANAINVSPGYLTQLKRGKPDGRDITEKTARKIEKLLGLPDGWMDETRSGVAAVESPKDEKSVTIPLYISSFGITKDRHDKEEIMPELVTERWLTRKCLKLSDLVTIHYESRNMIGTYQPGDRLIVNKSADRTLRDDSVLVFLTDEGEPVIRRIFKRTDGGICLANDNRSEFPDEIVPAHAVHDLVVLGAIERLIRDN